MKKAPVKKEKKVVKPRIKPARTEAVLTPKAEAEAPVVVRQEKSPGHLPYLYAVGKRKSASARVRLYPKDNRGQVTVNGKDYKTYFPYFEFQNIIEQPLKKSGLLGKYFISVKVLGGGFRGQAEAVRHGLARVLLKLDETYRKSLRSEGWLTRDPREKERKKPGLKRARRAPQWQKR